MIEYLVSRKSAELLGAAMFLTIMIAASPAIARVTWDDASWVPAANGRELVLVDLVAYGMDIEPSGMVPGEVPRAAYGMDIEPSGILPAEA